VLKTLIYLFDIQVKNIEEKNMFLNFILAKLHNGNPERWYFSYYVIKSGSQKFHRKIIKINRINSLTLRKQYARKLINVINLKLNEGWNPFIKQIVIYIFCISYINEFS